MTAVPPVISSIPGDATDVVFYLRAMAIAAGASYPADVLGEQLPPVLTSLNPASIEASTPPDIIVSTPVTITGTGFNHNAHVIVDGVSQATEWISATQVRYIAQATSVGTQDVQVANGPSAPSNTLVLDVTAPAGFEGAMASQEQQSQPPSAPDSPPPDAGGSVSGGRRVPT